MNKLSNLNRQQQARRATYFAEEQLKAQEDNSKIYFYPTPNSVITYHKGRKVNQR